MMPATAAAGVYALLTDGTTTEIGPPGPEDGGAVTALHETMSPRQRLPAILRPRHNAPARRHSVCAGRPGRAARISGELAPVS